MIRLPNLLIAFACATVIACGSDNVNKPENACDFTADAAKDYLDFLRDYPNTLPAARIDLANMQSSLTAAGHAATGSGALFSAIQNAQHAVDNAQAALDNNQAVNTGAISSAMGDIGNLCSQGGNN